MNCPAAAADLLVKAENLAESEGDTAADLAEQSIRDIAQYYKLKRKDDALIDYLIDTCGW